jgi:glycosyltransferase involved in cell wall biosynthesis
MELSDRYGLKVSVIIPTYNRAMYLSEALSSVFAQYLKPCEIIVVDDGSTDNTPELMRSFELQVIYVRHEENRGISAARNTGLKTARGEIIAWLDSDDLWEPEHLSTLVPVLIEDESIDGVYSGLVRIDSAGKVLPQKSLLTVSSDCLYDSLIESCPIQTSTFVVRKRCFDHIGEFDTDFDICEDYDMFLRLARSYRIVGVPRALVQYRIHSQNTVSNPLLHSQSRIALAEKHFGNAEGDPKMWSVDKRRAHAFAYRSAGLECMRGGLPVRGWRYLERAISMWPELLERVDTFYEVACGEQALGYRGDAKAVNVENKGREILKWLDDLFDRASSYLGAKRQQAYGNAHLALAMLSDQADLWGHARTHMFYALWIYPALLGRPGVLRRFIKLCAGKYIINRLSNLTPCKLSKSAEESE